MATPALPELTQADLQPGQFPHTPIRTRRKRRIVSDGRTGPQSSPVAAISRDLTPPRRKRAASTSRAPISITQTDSSPNAKLLAPESAEDKLPTPSRRPGLSVLPQPQNVNSMPEFSSRERSRRSANSQLPSRAQTEPVSLGSRFSTADRTIQQRIESGPNANRPKTKKDVPLGYTYILNVQLHANGPSLLKIGSTQFDPKQRAGRIKSCCLPARIEENPRAIAQSAPFYWVAERLVQHELAAYRYTLECVCSTAHREYFQVPEDVALDSLNRWRSFCQQEPWDEYGKLKDIWVQRLRNRCKYDDKVPGDSSAHSRRLASHWRAFTDPWWAESMFNDFADTARRIFRWRLHVLALGEAFALALRIPLNSWAPHWVGLVIILVFVEFSQVENLYTTNLIARTCRGGWQKIHILLDSFYDMGQPMKESEIIEPSNCEVKAPEVHEISSDSDIVNEEAVPEPGSDVEMEDENNDEAASDTIYVRQMPPKSPARIEVEELMSSSDSG
ncbi:hypothetical protein HJFPF1_05658 [Paramyrothecium foliicola]|nr:hypothetical protein HJFPF1_05658 [Paramyrothecium foliicola]